MGTLPDKLYDTTLYDTFSFFRGNTDYLWDYNALDQIETGQEIMEHDVPRLVAFGALSAVAAVYRARQGVHSAGEAIVLGVSGLASATSLFLAAAGAAHHRNLGLRAAEIASASE